MAATQKTSALKWISRQSIRLLSQCSETHRERQLIGMIIGDLECHLRQLYEKSREDQARDTVSASPDMISIDHSPMVQNNKKL